MNALAFRLELRRSGSLTLWTGLTVVAYVAIIGLMYPVIHENAAAVQDYLKLFPKEFMAAFGMSGSLDDPGVFFTTYIGSFLWPVVAAIAAIITGTRPSAADAERGWLDLTLGTPLTRTGSMLASIAGQIIVMAVLALLAVATVLAAGAASSAPFDAEHFLVASIPLFAFGCAIAGVASAIAVVTLSRGRAAGIVTGVLLAMYLANIVGQVQTSVSWLTSLSAFHYLNLVALIDQGQFPAGDVAAFGLVAVAGWAVAVWRFRTRDLLT